MTCRQEKVKKKSIIECSFQISNELGEIHTSDHLIPEDNTDTMASGVTREAHRHETQVLNTYILICNSKTGL